MRKIETISELRTERKRLRESIRRYENSMKADVENLRTSLEPVNMIMNTVGKSFRSQNNNMINKTVGFTVDTLLRKILLRNSNFIVRMLVPFLAKNIASNYVTDHQTDILGWLRQKASKLFSKNGKPGHYDQSTADIEATTW